MTGRMNAGWGMAGENAAGKRVIGKPVAGILMCIAVAASSPSVSLAGSPEFAYTAEQWASFRDNKLEFDEIIYLIHEYNNTVIQNQIEYKSTEGRRGTTFPRIITMRRTMYTEPWIILTQVIPILPAGCPPI